MSSRLHERNSRDLLVCSFSAHAPHNARSCLLLRPLRSISSVNLRLIHATQLDDFSVRSADPSLGKNHARNSASNGDFAAAGSAKVANASSDAVEDKVTEMERRIGGTVQQGTAKSRTTLERKSCRLTVCRRDTIVD